MLDNDSEFEALLNALKRTHNLDFTGYKRTGLQRQFEKRMHAVGAQEFAHYAETLKDEQEALRLLQAVLINVTGFFRDPAAWEYLSQVVIPEIISAKGLEEPIRVWSAGCASGAEAYTLAIIFAEALGLEEFRRRVQIYATDLDEDALRQGRQATYGVREVGGVPAALLEKYFHQTADGFHCLKELRHAIIFARHNLTQDAPISRIDVLACRNTLMYFNAEMQERILTRLHFALRNKGVLFVGKSEMLATHDRLFLPLHLKGRVFGKVTQGLKQERLFQTRQANVSPQRHILLNTEVVMQDVVFDSGVMAQLVVDSEGRVSLINEQAKKLFRLFPEDLGRPLHDLELSYRPADLRSLIDEVYAQRHPVGVRGISWPKLTGETVTLDLMVLPLLGADGGILGVSITFTDVTSFHILQRELQTSNAQLETAYEELQSTNEELETTYEELQSTIEELETTNEELQSTNEELETMNEEIQSTNQELQIRNDETQQRGSELKTVNTFLNSILNSHRSGVVVLDVEMLVQVWNEKAEDMWGLRVKEVQGKHFWNLDIGLPVERLTQPIRDCLIGQGTHAEISLASRNRRGKEIECRVTITPLVQEDGERQGVLLLMDEVDVTVKE